MEGGGDNIPYSAKMCFPLTLDVHRATVTVKVTESYPEHLCRINKQGS